MKSGIRGICKMPISSISGVDVAVASATATEIVLDLGIEPPKSKKEKAWGINIHGVVFEAIASASNLPVPIATTKFRQYSLRSNHMSTPAIKHECEDEDVIICKDYGAVATLTNDNGNENRIDLKIPYFHGQRKLYLEVYQDSGAAIKMGCRVLFTWVEMDAEAWVWSNQQLSE